MTQPLTLYLPLQTFERLHALVGGKKKKSVRVGQAELLALLMDHSRVLAMLQDLRVATEESYESCDHIRQARHNGS